MQESTAQESPYRICLHPFCLISVIISEAPILVPFHWLTHLSNWPVRFQYVIACHKHSHWHSIRGACRYQPCHRSNCQQPSGVTWWWFWDVSWGSCWTWTFERGVPAFFVDELYGFHSFWWKLTGKLSPETLRKPSALPQLGALWNSCGSWVETMQVEGSGADLPNRNGGGMALLGRIYPIKSTVVWRSPNRLDRKSSWRIGSTMPPWQDSSSMTCSPSFPGFQPFYLLEYYTYTHMIYLYLSFPIYISPIYLYIYISHIYIYHRLS